MTPKHQINFTKELIDLSRKHKIDRLMVLFSTTQEDKTAYHVILTEPKTKDGKISMHEFSNFYNQCLRSSKTFYTVVKHAAEHFISNVIDTMELEKGGKRAD